MSFDVIRTFEKDLASFTGAPFAIMTDCCTHAIELCLRHDKVKKCAFTPRTYLSIPMTMHKLGISYEFLKDEWQQWLGEYPFVGTRVWDSARRLQENMYKKGAIQCLSFGHGKPFEVGRGGAILLDDPDTYAMLTLMRYDGRDLTIAPWQSQKVFPVGYHYRPTIEEAQKALDLFQEYKLHPVKPVYVEYPNCADFAIIDT
jgi:dTDP-4-amino-4,6-dideoxygalactose transaminase